jgi:molybdate transport system substrate-binding protein
MKKRVFAALLLGLLGAGAMGGTPTHAADKVTLHYSAAASLKDTLTEIGQKYEKKHSNIKLEFDFAGSGQIKQKVLEGAPIDGVLTASEADMTALTDKNKATNSFVLLKNDLVVVQNKKADPLKGSLTSDLKQAKKIAIGQPKLVPAGRYATESLQKLKLDQTLKSKFVYANDVRQVLAYVAAGNADLGFVYRTDAKISKKVRIVKTVPASTHAPIRYYVGVTTTDKTEKKAVQQFNRYLKGKTAQKIFKAADFKMATVK